MKVLEFFAFNLDYKRIENVQFEDDDYYYYVKAVPKVAVATPDRKVKQINRATTLHTEERTERVERNTTRSQSQQRPGSAAGNAASHVQRSRNAGSASGRSQQQSRSRVANNRAAGNRQSRNSQGASSLRSNRSE